MGIQIYTRIKLGISVIQFDDKGDLIRKYPINTTNDVIQTKDYGFLSLGSPSEGLHAIKLKPDGTQE